MPPLMIIFGLAPKKPDRPEHDVGQLARLQRADLVGDAVRDAPG